MTIHFQQLYPLFLKVQEPQTVEPPRPQGPAKAGPVPLTRPQAQARSDQSPAVRGLFGLRIQKPGQGSEASEQALGELREALRQYVARYAEYLLGGYHLAEGSSEIVLARVNYLADFEFILHRAEESYRKLWESEKISNPATSRALTRGLIVVKFLRAYRACLRVYEISRRQRIKEKASEKQGLSYNSVEVWGRYHLKRASQALGEAEQNYLSLLLDLTHEDDAELRQASVGLKDELEAAKLYLEDWKQERPYLLPLSDRTPSR